MASPSLRRNVKPHRGEAHVSPACARVISTYLRRQSCGFSRSADQGLHKMRIIARTVMSYWTNGMVTRFALSASMTHVKEGSNGVYASGGRHLTSILSSKGILCSGASNPPNLRHCPMVAGSSTAWSRHTSGSLPQSNPVTCRTIETLGRTDETDLVRNVASLSPAIVLDSDRSTV
jgi:hypothetical protein